MKYAAETERTVKGTVFVRIDLPEMAHAPVLVAALPIDYTEEQKTAACEARLTEMKQIITSEDSRETTFDDTFERISLSAAKILKRKK